MGRVFTALVVLALVVVGIAGGTAVTAQSDEPEQYFSGTGEISYTTNVGGTQTYKVALTNVDTVGHFEYEFAVSDPEVGAIVDAAPGPEVSEFEATIGPNNASVSVEGSGASFTTDGFVDRHLELTVRGRSPGYFDIVPETVTVADANGTVYDIQTADESVQVTERPIAVASVRGGPGSDYDSTIPIDGEGEVTIVTNAADRSVGGFEVNVSRYYEDDPDLRFVDATVLSEAANRSVTFGPNGSYVEVSASGLDTDQAGTVPLVNVTVRGLERGQVLIEQDVDSLTDARGTEYVIDHRQLATVNVTDPSDRGVPTFARAPTGDPDPSATAPDPTATTDRAGPGFTGPIALLAATLALGAMTRRVSR